MRRIVILIFVMTAASACGKPQTPTGPDPALTPLERRGQAVFTIHCAPCHATAPETVIAGPSLAGIGTFASERVAGMSAEEYIRTSILTPTDYLVEGYAEAMPPDFGKRLNGEDFDSLVAYLLTLE